MCRNRRTSNFDLSVCFLCSFSSNSGRKRTKRTPLKEERVGRVTDFASHLRLRHPLPLKYPPHLRQSLSVSEEISRINNYLDKICFNFDIFKVYVVLEWGDT